MATELDKFFQTEPKNDEINRKWLEFALKMEAASL
jgi:hypothetical protein